MLSTRRDPAGKPPDTKQTHTHTPALEIGVRFMWSAGCRCPRIVNTHTYTHALFVCHSKYG